MPVELSRTSCLLSALAALLLFSHAFVAENLSAQGRFENTGEPRGVVNAAYDSFVRRPQSLKELVKAADVIVEGRVDSIFSGRLRHMNDPTSVETDALFSVDRVLKGQSESLRSLVITQMGGKYHDLEVVVEGLTRLNEGDQHILFLRYDRRPLILPTHPRTDGQFVIAGPGMGDFKLEGTAIRWIGPSDANLFRKFENGTAEDFIAQILAEVSSPPLQTRADELVQELRELPTPLPGLAPGNGQIPPIEQLRRELYRQIRQLGTDALPALQRGLRDNDVQIRRNVALIFMQLVSGYWVDEVRPKSDIRNSLPTLLTALDDVDGNVRGWSAQAIGGIGPDAGNAVPALIRLLKNSEEGSRNSACIALRGIGPAAKEALPALNDALSDSSPNVRGFARRAIESIQGH